MANIQQLISAFLSHNRDGDLALCFPPALGHKMYKKLLVLLIFEMSSLSKLVETGEVQKLIRKAVFSSCLRLSLLSA